MVPASHKDPEGWSAVDTFTEVPETAGLNASELSAYCRERGLYPEQVERWRQASQDANEKPGLTLRELRELEKLRAQDQREIKRLQKELRKKVGFPRFHGHRSGVHRGECTGSDECLLVVDRTHVADR